MTDATTGQDKLHQGGPSDYLLIHADAGHGVPLNDGSVDLCLCSPPYLGLRQYQGVDPTDWPAVRFAPMPGLEPVTVPAMTCTLGNEKDPLEFVGHLVHVFRDVRRVLNAEGVAVVNMGDCYSSDNSGRRVRDSNGGFRDGLDSRTQSATSANPGRAAVGGIPPLNLLGVPWRLAFALQADGWLLRSAPPWIKPDNAMPESVQSRPGTAHEMIFILVKSDRYYWDADAVRRPSVYGGPPKPGKQAQNAITGLATHSGQLGVGNPAGRNLRTSDIFMDSLDECIAYHRARAAELEAVRDRGGMIVGGEGEGEAAAILANPQSFKGAHFATFNTKLISPFIRAATSEKHCSACGRGWRRVVEREVNGKRKVCPKDAESFDRRFRGRDGLVTSGLHGQYLQVDRQTLGWSPACSCSAPTRPAVVLDPFGGSGSTAVAALALGRSAVILDASADYLALASRRLDRPHAAISAPVTKSPAPLPLFPEDAP